MRMFSQIVARHLLSLVWNMDTDEDSFEFLKFIYIICIKLSIAGVYSPTHFLCFSKMGCIYRGMKSVPLSQVFYEALATKSR